jgi:hypothetical protein
MKQPNKKTLKEHLSENDLKWLVDDKVLIDMHCIDYDAFRILSNQAAMV